MVKLGLTNPIALLAIGISTVQSSWMENAELSIEFGAILGHPIFSHKI
jgi:hypothetical protein